MEKHGRLVISVLQVLQKKVSEVSAASESSMVYVSCRGALSDWRNVIEVVSLAADPCWNHLPLARCQPQLPDPTGRYDPDPQNPRIKHQLGFPAEVWSAFSDMVSHTAWQTLDIYIKTVIYQCCRASLWMRNEITYMCYGQRILLFFWTLGLKLDTMIWYIDIHVLTVVWKPIEDWWWC